MMEQAQCLIEELVYQHLYLQKNLEPLYTHCYEHAFNLAVQEAVKANIILRDQTY